MELLIAILLLGGLAVFQSAVLSGIPLLMGTADVLLLAVIAWSVRDRVKTAWHWSLIGGLLATIGSALPFGVLIGNYLIITEIAKVVRKRVWKVPILAMFIMTFIGTMIVQASSFITRLLSGITIPMDEAINLIVLPSLILNVFLAIPVFLVITDIAGWLYRDEIKA